MQVKKVKADEVHFARKVRDLEPLGIDWSNLPDYIERSKFLEFAKKCSNQKDATLHHLHSTEWTRHVFGARPADFRWIHDTMDTCNEFGKGQSVRDSTENLAKIKGQSFVPSTGLW